MRILSLLLLCTVLIKSKIIIQDASMASLSRDDIGMIFYIALHNADDCAYQIYVRMVKCVEEVDTNDKDCEIMKLMGGDMGTIKSRCSKNITLLYPNMYLHNRKGYCIIAIKFTTTDDQILEKKTNITFNTLIRKSHKVPAVLIGYYDRKSVMLCDSVDLDPLNKCNPVNCHLKYVGTRNYFNKNWKRCQKVPYCVYDMDKMLPDVGYTPVTNKCLDLERSIRKSELQPLDNKFSEIDYQMNKYSTLLTNINCHYGKMNNATGVCDCMEGWTSAHFEKDPSLFTFHMCNIEKLSWYDSNRSMVTFVAFFIAIAAVAVAMLVVLISFVFYYLYKCLKSLEGPKGTCRCTDVEMGKDRKPSPNRSPNPSPNASPYLSPKTSPRPSKHAYSKELQTKPKSGSNVTSDTTASSENK